MTQQAIRNKANTQALVAGGVFFHSSNIVIYIAIYIVKRNDERKIF